ncbi:MAG: TlpA disulfide reductase family protein [Bacteroidetes bacterium]|nr:TlpA disulfide reductase family protein [Bacteroidota bacterium]
MKKCFLIVFLISFSSHLSAQVQDQHPILNKKIPAVEIKDINGNSFNTRNLENYGKPFIIIFWATWCQPCIKPLDTIAKYYNDWFKETGFRLYAVSVDNEKSFDLVKSISKAHAWKFIVLIDRNRDFARSILANSQVPSIFIVNSKDEIVWVYQGFPDGNAVKKESTSNIIKLLRKLNVGEDIRNISLSD